MHLPEEFNPEEQINFRIIPPNQKPYWLMNPCYPLPKAVTKKNLSFSKPLTIHPPANQNYHTCFHHGSIVVKDLSFSYDENKPVLTNISFQVHPGQFVGIVGPTGSGKSTFINLLTKFYDLQTGEIFFNGISIKKITKESLRKNIALVLQDNILFETTFFQNIAYGNLNASYDDVVLAAKLTGLSELIAKQNNQYATIINRSQNNLSEGEKQLIAITRALLSDAPILIFDEATALVDLKTEYQIKQAMKKLLKTKTAFVIAHRLSTIRDADLILVFNQGKLIEQGTHLQLMAQKSFYYHLYHAQP